MTAPPPASPKVHPSPLDAAAAASSMIRPILLTSFLLSLILVASGSSSPSADTAASAGDEGAFSSPGFAGGGMMGAMPAPAPPALAQRGAKLHRANKRSAGAPAVAMSAMVMEEGAAEGFAGGGARSADFASDNAAAVRSSMQEMAAVRAGDSGSDPTALKGTLLIKDAHMGADVPEAER